MPCGVTARCRSGRTCKVRLTIGDGAAQATIDGQSYRLIGSGRKAKPRAAQLRIRQPQHAEGIADWEIAVSDEISGHVDADRLAARSSVDPVFQLRRRQACPGKLERHQPAQPAHRLDRQAVDPPVDPGTRHTERIGCRREGDPAFRVGALLADAFDDEPEQLVRQPSVQMLPDRVAWTDPGCVKSPERVEK